MSSNCFVNKILDVKTHIQDMTTCIAFESLSVARNSVKYNGLSQNSDPECKVVAVTDTA